MSVARTLAHAHAHDLNALVPRSENGVLVSYGGAAGAGLTLPVSLLSSRNVTVRGFSLARWLDQNAARRQALADAASELVATGVVENLCVRYSADKFAEAFAMARSPKHQRKPVIVFDGQATKDARLAEEQRSAAQSRQKMDNPRAL